MNIESIDYAFPQSIQNMEKMILVDRELYIPLLKLMKAYDNVPKLIELISKSPIN